MPLLRRGFLKSANRPNNLYCRIDPSPVEAIFIALLYMFPILTAYHGTPSHSSDLPRAVPARKLPFALREGNRNRAYSRRFRLLLRSKSPRFLPNQIRTAVYGGAEKRIYIRADARGKYRDVKAILCQIRASGVENVSFLSGVSR
jgi:biopolymer transport protein ExbD